MKSREAEISPRIKGAQEQCVIRNGGFASERELAMSKLQKKGLYNLRILASTTRCRHSRAIIQIEGRAWRHPHSGDPITITLRGLPA
jgi:hypothetical protein